jgi:Zn finger protein HypA/HybF involved in hydrogenase expression
MNHYLDGNAVAGELSEIFASELTDAVATCAACGATGAVALVHVYELGIGTVLRCPQCDSVLMRIVHATGETHMEMAGVKVLRWKNAA